MLAVTYVANREGRSFVVMEIGDAFLNFDITSTGVKVHMRLDKVLTTMLVLVVPKHTKLVEEQGASVVQLEKALHGCVEATTLWYANVCATLALDGVPRNPSDSCAFGKMKRFSWRFRWS